MQRAQDTFLMGQGQDRGGFLTTLAEIREQWDPTDPTGEAEELLTPKGSGDPVTQQKDHPTRHQDLQERGQCHQPSAIDVDFAIQFQTAGFGAGWAALLVAGSLHPTSTDWFGGLAGFATSCHVIQACLLHLKAERVSLGVMPSL